MLFLFQGAAKVNYEIHTKTSKKPNKTNKQKKLIGQKPPRPPHHIYHVHLPLNVVWDGRGAFTHNEIPQQGV